MGRRSTQTPLAAEVARFQEAVRSVAIEMVRAVVRQEIQRRIDEIGATLGKPTTRRRHALSALTTSPPAPTSDQNTQSEVPAAPPSEPKKRWWTREAIVDELASWLVSGTTVDASFVTRYGPPGLVAASRKEFGRFDAALNVASLRVSKLYQDGPQTRIGGATRAPRV